jgi:hypothetical protein
MSLDIGRAITFVSQEANTVVKILIGGALVFLGFSISIGISLVFSLIGGGSAFALAMAGDTATASTGASLITYFLGLVAAFIGSAALIPVSGYAVQVTRNVITGQPNLLPDWSNFGEFVTEGAKLWVCTFIVSLPAGIVYYGSQFPAAAAPSNTSLGFVTLCGACLAFPLLILSGLLSPIVYGRYAMTRDIRQTLNFSEMFATLRANLGTYFLILVALIGLLLAGVFLSAFTCFIALPFAFFFWMLISAHLAGQAHLISQGGAVQPAYGSPYGTSPYGEQRPF